MKIFTAAALALLLSAGGAFAQETGTGANSSGSGSDPANYLTGPDMKQFYTDDSMGTMRSDAEMKTAYQAMKEEDRMRLKSSCGTNSDAKFTDFCKSINAM